MGWFCRCCRHQRSRSGCCGWTRKFIRPVEAIKGTVAFKRLNNYKWTLGINRQAINSQTMVVYHWDANWIGASKFMSFAQVNFNRWVMKRMVFRSGKLIRWTIFFIGAIWTVSNAIAFVLNGEATFVNGTVNLVINYMQKLLKFFKLEIRDVPLFCYRIVLDSLIHQSHLGNLFFRRNDCQGWHILCCRMRIPLCCTYDILKHK